MLPAGTSKWFWATVIDWMSLLQLTPPLPPSRGSAPALSLDFCTPVASSSSYTLPSVDPTNTWAPLPAIDADVHKAASPLKVHFTVALATSTAVSALLRK